MYEARSMTKCPLTRGIRLTKMSVSEGSTVTTITFSIVMTFSGDTVVYELEV